MTARAIPTIHPGPVTQTKTGRFYKTIELVPLPERENNKPQEHAISKRKETMQVVGIWRKIRAYIACNCTVPFSLWGCSIRVTVRQNCILTMWEGCLRWWACVGKFGRRVASHRRWYFQEGWWGAQREGGEGSTCVRPSIKYSYLGCEKISPTPWRDRLRISIIWLCHLSHHVRHRQNQLESRYGSYLNLYIRRGFRGPCYVWSATGRNILGGGN